LPPDAGGQPAIPFVDVTSESGPDFVHVNGATGELLLPEVIGAGGALFDFDNDGDLDLFVVQSGTIPSRGSGRGTRDSELASRDSKFGADTTTSKEPRSRLYRNDPSPGGRTRFRFTDVTDRSGIVMAGYGMGAATGDFDGDGWLDLFVVNYVDFKAEMKRGCFSASSARDYCNPAVYDPVAGKLLHNNRDGTFSDVTTRAGIDRAPGRGLGVLASDVNGDGWTDLYVANDGDPNRLWINERGSGVFQDEALLSGLALSRTGQPQGSMGVDAADVDGDGDEDLFVTNLDNEGNTLYLNVGRGLFEDRTVEFGLFKLGFTGFGTRFIDYDNDGWLDLVVVNGAVRHLSSQVQHGDPYPLKQRSQLFRNDRGRRFQDVSDTAGPAFAELQVARGAATGDLDNDGDTDIVVFNNSGPVRVLLNDVGSRRHWLGIRAIDSRYRRDALHSRVTLAGGRSVHKTIQTDGSYCVANDPRVLFGLGSESRPQTVRVQWAGGQMEEFRGLAVDRYWVLEPGKTPRPW
jgi:hypothetical protein